MTYDDFCKAAQSKGIPERMVDGLWRWVDQGILPGDFLRAVIANDLKRAVGYADDENIRLLPNYVRFLYNEVPAACHGSEQRMMQWEELKYEERETQHGS